MGSFYHNGKVMDRRATKDTYEREEEEAERLVRPAPKVKPPRDDKKREDVHEHDPDTDGAPDLKGDPDLSLNYKSVGGSLAERVAEKWVRVKNKELDKGTRVSPETLQEQPGKYEKVEKNEPDPPTGKPRPARKPAKPHLKKDRPPHPPWRDQRPLPPDGPRPARPPKPVKPVPVPKVQEPEKEPKTKPPGWVKKRYKPAAIVGRYLVGKQFDTEDELKAYLDEHKGADEEKHWVKGKEPDDKPKDEHQILDGVVDSPKLELDEGVQRELGEKRQKTEKADEEARTQVDTEKAEQEKAEKETAEKAKRAKKGPQPARRQPSKEELASMEKDALETFGMGMGPNLLAQKLHPDDYQRIKAQFQRNSLATIPGGDLDAHVEKLKSSGLFQLDGSKIGPPKQIENAKGEMVPFDSLPPKEQEEAWAQHRNDVLGASFALYSQVRQSLAASGMPPNLAVRLTHAKLGVGKPPGDVTENVIQSGARDKLNPKQRAKALSKLTNPKDRALAARYFQGQDYLDVRHEFFGGGEGEPITEHMPPRDFIQALRAGSSMLAERQKQYAPEDVSTDLGQLFRHRLLRRLEALAPEKAVIVQREVDEMDADDYDKSRKVWEKAHAKAEKEREKRDNQRAKIEMQFLADQQAAEDAATFRQAPKKVRPLEDRWADKGLSPEKDPPLPSAPAKPPRYDLVRGEPLRAKNQYDDLLARTEEPHVEEVADEDVELEEPKGKKGPPKPPPKKKQASTDHRVAWRVVGRYLAFSTCTGS